MPTKLDYVHKKSRGVIAMITKTLQKNVEQFSRAFWKYPTIRGEIKSRLQYL
jgi:hypothetical protein